MIKIDEGATYEYLAQGLILLILAMTLAALHWSLGLLVGIIAIGIMAMKTGLEIDLKKTKTRKYNSFLGHKSGRWINLVNYTHIDLKFNSQASKHGTRPILVGLSPGLMRERVHTTKTYDLILTNSFGEKFILNSFTKFGLAMKAIKSLEKIERIEVTNHIDNWVTTQLRERYS